MQTAAAEAQHGRRTSWAIAFAVACGAWWLAKVVWSNPQNQWDFKVYYFAAEAWKAGHNPNDPAFLGPAVGEDVYPFLYPPYSLGLFWLFTLVPLTVATKVFLALKLALLAWLVRTWARLLETPVWRPAWVLFLVFAYSSCIFIDFASGNVTTIEQVVLWAGIASLIEGRRWPFVWAVVIASLFKLSPIVLLLLLFALPQSRPHRYVLAGFGAFAGILGLTYAISPGLTGQFLQALGSLDERGRVNPALLPLVRDQASVFPRGFAFLTSARAQTALYGVIAAAIVVVTWQAALRSARIAKQNRLEATIYLALLGYALALPRFKNYSYMLLIVPTWFIATRSTRLSQAVPLLLLAGLPVYSWLTSTQNVTLLANYSQYLIALGAWCLFLYELRAESITTTPSLTAS